MYIAILGRQPALGIAELERLHGADSVRWFSDNSATVASKNFDFNRLGGSQKAGRVVSMIDRGDWRNLHTFIVQHYYELWRSQQHKITLGISAYGLPVSTRDIQRTGIELKKKLRADGVSLRLIPNREPILNTATSHHNKLGLSQPKVELLIVRGSSGRIIVAESIGAQNISAIAARDQARPKTDAFVGMLPPKLARIMVNLAAGSRQPDGLWDPFCGTGVILQEASLLGIASYGSDLSEKMVDYSRINLTWLRDQYHQAPTDMPLPQVAQGDATSFQPPASWRFDTIASESYLGQPFSSPPSADKLEQVRANCNHIISRSLNNFATQLPAGSIVCLAVPAWRRHDGHFIHLPLASQLEKLGYSRLELTNARPDQLLYYRENQIVARELLLLERR